LHFFNWYKPDRISLPVCSAFARRIRIVNIARQWSPMVVLVGTVMFYFFTGIKFAPLKTLCVAVLLMIPAWVLHVTFHPADFIKVVSATNESVELTLSSAEYAEQLAAMNSAEITDYNPWQ
jgi:hypothetical protein